MEAFVVELSPEEEELRKIIEPLLENEGFELVRLSVKRAHAKSLLGIFADTLDRPNGIVMRNLEFISRFLSDVLDVELEQKPLIPGSYELEVSSPGLDRPLTKRSHFEKALGERVKFRLKNPEILGTKGLIAALCEVNETGVLVEPDAKAGERVNIAFADMAEAHMVFDFSNLSQPKKKS